ncbi:hypothetical protein [Candidatus Amarolinea dominans]|uniref:hypothetical protein n=1 Tax=Candidatus Amarolinea dominans TaxID=3140696 RepID=UPI00313611E1|nr:hypothetical protein [Anaerolineae bacterium]
MSQSVGVAIERKRHSIKKPASRRNASKLPVQSTGGLSSRQSGGARGERSTLASPRDQLPALATLLRLEAVAQTENGVSFAAVYSSVDWAQQPPDIIERVLRALLLAGDHESARQLALRAANRYTDHVGLSKFAAILNPPPARNTTTGNGQLQKENREIAPSAGPLVKPGSVDEILTHLQIASDDGNEQAFHQAYAQVDWLQQPPEIIERVARLAFQAGLHYLAQTLARDGVALYPYHVGLQKFSQALNPRPAQVSHAVHDGTARADTQWFAKHSAEYYGQWVAVRDGQLVSAAATIQQLEVQIGDLRSAGPGQRSPRSFGNIGANPGAFRAGLTEVSRMLLTRLPPGAIHLGRGRPGGGVGGGGGGEGGGLSLTVIVFIPQLDPGEVWTLPSFVGLEGMLQRMRFAVDPDASLFYFGPLGEA